MMNKFSRLYLSLFLISLILFILQVFVFAYPDGNLGMVVCMVLVGVMTYTFIRLLQTSETFQKAIKQIISVLWKM